MAAPQHKNIHDLTGQWSLNHQLSDDISPALAIQGTNWLMRTVLARASVSLSITQTRDASLEVDTLYTIQKSMGRVVEEQRALNWEYVASSHIVFGNVETKARICAVDDIDNSLLRGDWAAGTVELVEVQSKGSGWTSWQAWGFEVIDGQRRHVRRLLLQKGHDFRELSSDYALVKMVYDWVEDQ